MSEVYYAISGTGEVTLGGETAPIRAGDAVPADLGEARAIRQTGGQPLELMVIGVARDLAAKPRYRAKAEARLPPRRLPRAGPLPSPLSLHIRSRSCMRKVSHYWYILVVPVTLNNY